MKNNFSLFLQIEQSRWKEIERYREIYKEREIQNKMSYQRFDIRKQSYPGPCSSYLVESCIHSAFYGTIWTIVFNDSKVFSQLGNISNSPTFKFIGKTPVGRFGVSCLLNSLPIFVIFGVTKTVACSVEKARRKTDKLNDFTGGFISGCTVGLLELNLSKHNQELMKKSSMKNSQQALKSIFGYGLFIGCIYSLLLTPRLPED